MAGGSFLATAYGPPWNAMNGSGVTSTGVPLSGQVPIIAVDPNVIPYGSIVRASNSPLGQNRLFVAGDTGGAIKGNHIDFYVASGRQAQVGWGARQINLQVVKPGSGPGSVHSALAQVGGMGGGAVSPPQGQTQGSSGSLSFTVPQTVQSFDQAGFDAAQAKFIAGNAVKEAGSSANPFNVAPGTSRGFASSLNAPNPLFAKGLLTTTAPNAGDFVSTQTIPQTINVAHQELQHIAGMPLAHPNVGGSVIARMFPQGARLPSVGRHDMGRDLENGQPGAPVLALGNGHVVSVNSDPSGFGNAYPVVHFDSGPWAGLNVYFGHVQALLHAGQAFRAGQPIAQLQNGTGPFVGNAAGMPGHIEIGMASQLGRGGQGPLPPGL